MWLINTTTLQLEWVLNPQSKDYAILSHTWNEGQEVTFADFRGNTCNKDSTGYKKILESCRLARERKPPLQYCWVDTCCIDKSSSAELTEAINSMYAWYQGAAVCFAYLEDIAPETWPEGYGMTLESREDAKNRLQQCRWLYRGWTLQELIAPQCVELYDAAWAIFGTKYELSYVLSMATKIPELLLTGYMEAQRYSTCARMCWAANRQTTRVEDTAYCLMGLFGINMPLLYGEGTKAFRRLQEEIIKQYHDPTLFLWEASDPREMKYRGLLARSPSEFPPALCSFTTPSSATRRNTSEINISNTGVKLKTRLIKDDLYILDLDCGHDGPEVGDEQFRLGVFLELSTQHGFVRARPSEHYRCHVANWGQVQQLPKRLITVASALTLEDVYWIDGQYTMAILLTSPTWFVIERVEPLESYNEAAGIFLFSSTQSDCMLELLLVPGTGEAGKAILVIGIQNDNPEDDEEEMSFDSHRRRALKTWNRIFTPGRDGWNAARRAIDDSEYLATHAWSIFRFDGVDCSEDREWLDRSTSIRITICARHQQYIYDDYSRRLYFWATLYDVPHADLVIFSVEIKIDNPNIRLLLDTQIVDPAQQNSVWRYYLNGWLHRSSFPAISQSYSTIPEA